MVEKVQYKPIEISTKPQKFKQKLIMKVMPTVQTAKKKAKRKRTNVK